MTAEAHWADESWETAAPDPAETVAAPTSLSPVFIGAVGVAVGSILAAVVAAAVGPGMTLVAVLLLAAAVGVMIRMVLP